MSIPDTFLLSEKVAFSLSPLTSLLATGKLERKIVVDREN